MYGRVVWRWKRTDDAMGDTGHVLDSLTAVVVVAIQHSLACTSIDC